MHFIGKQQKEGYQNSDSHYAEFPSNSTMTGTFCFMAHNNVNWAIDSGASDHMYNSLANFLHYKDVSSLNHSITLPNGTKVKVNKIGTVKLFDNLLLKDVLCVPEFKLNLILVHKLCFNNSISMLFTDELCLIQAPSIKRPMPLGKFHQGLYCVKVPGSQAFST